MSFMIEVVVDTFLINLSFLNWT